MTSSNSATIGFKSRESSSEPSANATVLERTGMRKISLLISSNGEIWKVSATVQSDAKEEALSKLFQKTLEQVKKQPEVQNKFFVEYRSEGFEVTIPSEKQPDSPQKITVLDSEIQALAKKLLPLIPTPNLPLQRNQSTLISVDSDSDSDLEIDIKSEPGTPTPRSEPKGTYAKMPASSPTKTSQPAQAASLKPIGLLNRSGSDCYSAALFQMIANNPKLRAAINEQSLQGETTAAPEILNALKNYDNGNSPDFSNFKTIYNFQDNGQEDIAEATDKLLSAIPALQSAKRDEHGFALPTISVKLYEGNNPQAEIGSLSSLLQKEQNPTQFVTDYPISSLFLHIARNENGTKYTGKIEIPETLSKDDLSKYYPSSENKDKPYTYELQSFAVHRGSSADNGHYVAYIKSQDGFYWECNDANVKQVPKTTFLEAAKDAYLLNYNLQN